MFKFNFYCIFMGKNAISYTNSLIKGTAVIKSNYFNVPNPYRLTIFFNKFVSNLILKTFQQRPRFPKCKPRRHRRCFKILVKCHKSHTSGLSIALPNNFNHQIYQSDLPVHTLLTIDKCTGNLDQNLHWKLGQQTPSAGTLLAYLETTA